MRSSSALPYDLIWMVAEHLDNRTLARLAQSEKNLHTILAPLLRRVPPIVRVPTSVLLRIGSTVSTCISLAGTCRNMHSRLNSVGYRMLVEQDKPGTHAVTRICKRALRTDEDGEPMTAVRFFEAGFRLRRMKAAQLWLRLAKRGIHKDCEEVRDYLLVQSANPGEDDAAGINISEGNGWVIHDAVMKDVDVHHMEGLSRESAKYSMYEYILYLSALSN